MKLGAGVHQVKWFITVPQYNALHKGRPRQWLPRRNGEFWLGCLVWKFHVRYLYRRGLFIVERRPWRPIDELPAGPVKVWGVPKMKKKVSKAALEGVKHLASVESDVFSQLMPLVEHCAVRQYDDGDSREPGWITIKTQGAAWCVQVKDPDACVSFTAIGDTLDKALSTAALLLSCDEAPWEPDTFLSAAKARRKK